MAFSFKKFFLGVALVAASVFVPGAFLATFASGALFATGTGLVGRGLFGPRFEAIDVASQGQLTQSANTLNHIPIVYSAAGVRVAGKVVFLDTRNLFGSPNARADMVL